VTTMETDTSSASDGRPERSRIALHASIRPRRRWEHRDWTEYAACAGTDLQVFFPIHKAFAKAPKAICARCPVIADCLIDALGAPWLEGIWAYTSRGERARLREGLDDAGTTAAELRDFAVRFAEHVRAIDHDHDHDHDQED
jgi:WhiB family redox-sensing transcriptional regulator